MKAKPTMYIEDEVGPIHDRNRKHLLELFNQAGEILAPPSLRVPVLFGTGGEAKNSAANNKLYLILYNRLEEELNKAKDKNWNKTYLPDWRS